MVEGLGIVLLCITYLCSITRVYTFYLNISSDSQYKNVHNYIFKLINKLAYHKLNFSFPHTIDNVS